MQVHLVEIDIEADQEIAEAGGVTGMLLYFFPLLLVLAFIGHATLS